MDELTKNQIDVLRHTRKNRFFGTSASGQDYEDCEALLSRGYMARSTAPRWSGDDFVYSLTRAGADALVNATGVCIDAIITAKPGTKFRFELFRNGNSVKKSNYCYRNFSTATFAALEGATRYCQTCGDSLKSLSISGTPMLPPSFDSVPPRMRKKLNPLPEPDPLDWIGHE